MKPVMTINKIGLGLNFRKSIKDIANKIAACQSKAASPMVDKSDDSKKVSSRIVKPADMIKPTDEAFKLFKALET